MFVGRDGDAAAILCLSSTTEMIGPGGVITHTSGTVLVGSAVGSPLPDGEMGWRIGGAKAILSRGVGVDSPAFLAALKSTVARAVADRHPQRASLAARVS